MSSIESATDANGTHPAHARLPALARQAITDRLREPEMGTELEARLPDDLDPALMAEQASFVTLTLGGQLRGCIGSLTATRPLALDVMHNAIDAAFRDPRFPPLEASELPDIAISVSVLSPLRPMCASTRTELLTELQPGRDGLLIGTPDSRHRATFLPAVWRQLPEPADFVGRLLQKAGLPADHDGPIQAERYTVSEYKEH